MRREGRQHGTVMAYDIATQPTGKKMPNQIDGPFMGIFSKVPSKPTNSSKYTSRCRVPRCGNCHDHPVNKARIKTKGNHRHRDEISDFYLKGGEGVSIELMRPVRGVMIQMIAANRTAEKSLFVRWVVVVVPETVKKENGLILCEGSGVVVGDCEHGEWMLVEGV